MIIILIGMKFSSGFPFWLLTLSIFVGPCLSSSENSVFQSFIHLKIHMFIFLPLPYESFLRISDINFLPDTWFANIFSYFNGLVFLSPIDYFLYWAIYSILVLSPCNSTCFFSPNPFLMSLLRNNHQSHCSSFLLYIVLRCAA